MGDNKKAAKEFVDKCFPEKKPDQLRGVLNDIFAKPVASRKQESEGQSSCSQSKTEDCNIQDGTSKLVSDVQKPSGNAVVLCEVSDSCRLNSSVDYGCRDTFYDHSRAQEHTGSSYRVNDECIDLEPKDRKKEYDYTAPENSRGEWWQGSVYY